jgi:hypothetical protein
VISGIRRCVNEILALPEILRSADRQFVIDGAAPIFKARAVFFLTGLTLENGSRHVGNKQSKTYGASNPRRAKYHKTDIHGTMLALLRFSSEASLMKSVFTGWQQGEN